MPGGLLLPDGRKKQDTAVIRKMFSGWPENSFYRAGTGKLKAVHGNYNMWFEEEK